MIGRGVTAVEPTDAVVIPNSPTTDTMTRFTWTTWLRVDATGALPGSVDEVRLAAVERSASWIRFQVELMNESIVNYRPFIPN
ncbi:MAG: hypothetical protein ACOCY8_01885 [Spirochaetota bacterium]